MSGTILGVRAPTPAEESYSDRQLNTRNYQLEFHVAMTTEALGARAVAAVAGLPAIGTAYSFGTETDADAKCKNRQFRRDAEVKNNWYVLCSYDTLPIIEQDIQVSYETETIEVPFIFDFSTPRKRVVNTLGLPFDPPLTRSEPISIVTVSNWWLAAGVFNLAFKETYEGKANAANFMGKPPGCVVCESLTSQSQFANNAWWSVAQVRYRVYEHPTLSNAADLSVLNTSNKYLDDDTDLEDWDKQVTSLKTFKTQGSVSHWPIDDEGHAIPVDRWDDIPASGSDPALPSLLHYLQFRRFPRISFAALPEPPQ